MKFWIAVVFATFVAGASAQCGRCSSMKWGTCDGSACQCTILVGDNMKMPLNCSHMVPKCILMKAEMYMAKKGLDTRSIGGKPVETAFVDNDGIYDPVCENDGTFKAKQCNNTAECWCVNSAGVRRTDKGDVNIVCDKLVHTYWVRLQLKYAQNVSLSVDSPTLTGAIKDAINARYDNFNPALVKEVQYDPAASLIVVDVKKDIGERKSDLSRMAYYMEKDIKKTPLFVNQDKFAPTVAGQKLHMEDILIYYVDEEAPTFTMQKLTGGIIAVIVVVILAVIAGLLVVFFARKQQQKKYAKAAPREMEAM